MVMGPIVIDRNRKIIIFEEKIAKSQKYTNKKPKSK